MINSTLTSSFFSSLDSGIHILPHSGPTNKRIRAQLGLKIPKTENPEKAYMRVGDQFLHWEDGKMIIFDESYEHEVLYHNERNESRLVLYFDFWHPDLSPEQRVERDGDFNEYGHLIYDVPKTHLSLEFPTKKIANRKQFLDL